jgi:hypothetical protein
MTPKSYSEIGIRMMLLTHICYNITRSQLLAIGVTWAYGTNIKRTSCCGGIYVRLIPSVRLTTAVALPEVAVTSRLIALAIYKPSGQGPVLNSPTVSGPDCYYMLLNYQHYLQHSAISCACCCCACAISKRPPIPASTST